MNSIDILEEKEKKAIEILHNWLCDEHSKFCRVGAVGIPNEEFFATEIVLNLVKNLIAENKELKEENKHLIEINNKYNDMKYITRIAMLYIPKSKIKAKIEEITKEWAEGELDGEWYEFMKYHLQSLLEKE